MPGAGLKRDRTEGNMRRLGNSISICVTIAMALSLLPGAAAFAEGESLPSCSGDTVSGTVVAVDSTTGLVTIQQSDSTQCTVSMNATYDQPIVGLLGSFFENVTPELTGSGAQLAPGHLGLHRFTMRLVQ